MNFYKLSKNVLLLVSFVTCLNLNEAKSNVHKGISAFESKDFNLAKENFCHMIKYGNFFSYPYLKYMNDKLHLKIPCLSQVELKSIPHEIQKASQSYLNASLVQMKTLNEGYDEDLIWSMYHLVLNGNVHATLLLGQWIEEKKISISALENFFSDQEKNQIIDLKSFYIFALKKIKVSKIILNSQMLLKINELFFSNSLIQDLNFEKNCPEILKYKNQIKNFSNAVQNKPDLVGTIALIVAGMSNDNHDKLLWYTLALENGLENKNYIEKAVTFVFKNSWEVNPFIARYYAKFYFDGFQVRIQEPNLYLNYALMLGVGMGGNADLKNCLKHLAKIYKLNFGDSKYYFIVDFLREGQTKQGFFNAFLFTLKNDMNNPVFMSFFEYLIQYSWVYFSDSSEESLKFVRELVIYFSSDEYKDYTLYKPSTIHAARYFHHGIGGPKDLNSAKKYYLKASLQGDEDAQKSLITMVVNNKDKNSFSDEVYDFTINFAKQGSALYQYLVGYLNYNGEIKNPNLEVADYFLLKAAQQNFSKAQYNYALLLISQMNKEYKINLNDTNSLLLINKYPFLYYLTLASKNELKEAKFLLNEFFQLKNDFYIKVRNKFKFNCLKFEVISEYENNLRVKKVFLSNEKIKIFDITTTREKFEQESNQFNSKGEDEKLLKSPLPSFSEITSDHEHRNDSDESSDEPSKLDDGMVDSSAISEEIQEELNFWDKEYKKYQLIKNNSMYQSKKNDLFETDNKDNNQFKIKNLIIEREKLSLEVNEFIDDVFGYGNKKFTKYTKKELDDILKKLGCNLYDKKKENSTQVSFSHNGKLIAKTSYHNPHEHSDDRLDYGIRGKLRKFFYAIGLKTD